MDEHDVTIEPCSHCRTVSSCWRGGSLDIAVCHVVMLLWWWLRFEGETIPVVRGSALCALNGERHDIGKDAVSRLSGQAQGWAGGGVRWAG
jgi:hypothetical protein